MAAELPVPYLEGVTIRDVGDGLIIRIDGAPDLDRALLKIGARQGVRWDPDQSVWRTTSKGAAKAMAKVRAIARTRADRGEIEDP